MADVIDFVKRCFFERSVVFLSEAPCFFEKTLCS